MYIITLGKHLLELDVGIMCVKKYNYKGQTSKSGNIHSLAFYCQHIWFGLFLGQVLHLIIFYFWVEFYQRLMVLPMLFHSLIVLRIMVNKIVEHNDKK